MCSMCFGIHQDGIVQLRLAQEIQQDADADVLPALGADNDAGIASSPLGSSIGGPASPSRAGFHCELWSWTPQLKSNLQPQKTAGKADAGCSRLREARLESSSIYKSRHARIGVVRKRTHPSLSVSFAWTCSTWTKIIQNPSALESSLQSQGALLLYIPNCPEDCIEIPSHRIGLLLQKTYEGNFWRVIFCIDAEAILRRTLGIYICIYIYTHSLHIYIHTYMLWV